MTSDGKTEVRPGARLPFAIAAVAYLALALWSYRAILPDPSSLLPIARERFGDRALAADLYRSDRRFVVSVVAEGSRRILAGDFDLHEQSSCFPLSQAGTLGEHMIGESLLGVVPYALTGEPITTFNAVDILSVWIAALGMYALAYFWTGHAGGAFVAGLLFGFHPSRITNPAHPFVYGNLWTPLALLAAHQLMARGRWRDAVLLALFLSLQLLESLYQILALAILGGVYGVYLLVRYRSSLPRLLPKLALVAAVAIAVAVWVFAPYLEMRSVWGLLQGRSTPVLLWPASYLPGRSASFGLLGLILAAIALVDRARRPRPRDGSDPRWIFAIGGLLIAWSTLGQIDIGSLQIHHPSPLVWAGRWIPGIDALRVLSSLRFGVFLVVAFLSAYGVQVLTERLRGATRMAAIALLVAAAAIEVLHPTIARALYLWHPALAAEPERPTKELLELFARAPAGAVIDLPATSGSILYRSSRAIFLSAYHGRPVASCYNSFATPLGDDIARLGDALPEAAAADALYALGFRIVVAHRRVALPPFKLNALLNGAPRLTRLGGTPDFEVLRLESPTRTISDTAALAPGGPTALTTVRAGGVAEIPLTIVNKRKATFLHRHPIQPQPLVLAWEDGTGRTVSRETVQALLPVALGSGARMTRTVQTKAPAEPGRYKVVASLPDRPRAPLSTAAVQVVTERDAPAPEGDGRERSLPAPPTS